MRILISFLLVFLLIQPSRAQSADEQTIRKVLGDQTIAWNNGNIEEFMRGYWNNDSLMFIGKSGVTYVYHNTLMDYKKHYNGADAMGTLSFELIKVQRLSPEYYFIVGKWHLKRNIGDVGGHYNLLFRKINGAWVIVADHSS
jgi:ketosteroid isomerase-like protein